MEKCGCEIIMCHHLKPCACQFAEAGPQIKYCPLHSRAQSMRAALEKIATEYVDINICSLCGNQWKAIPETVKIAKAALKGK